MRRFLKQLGIHAATVLMSSLGFACSVLMHCITLIFPSMKTQVPPSVSRQSMRECSASLSSMPSGVVSSSSRQKLSRRSGRRRLRPTSITIVPPATGTITISTSPGIGMTASRSAGSVSFASEPARDEYFPDEFGVYGGYASYDDEKPSTYHRHTPLLRKSSLGKHIPPLFRRKSRHSSPSSSSPVEPSPRNAVSAAFRRKMKLTPMDSRESEEHLPRAKSTDDVEGLKRGLNKPLAFVKKHMGLTPLTTPTRESMSFPQTPDCSEPPRPSHRRTGSLACYIQSAIHPASRSPSPRRSSLSSFSVVSSSSGTSSFSASRRSFSHSFVSTRSKEVKRTEPYGPPYYAAMPVPRIPRRSTDPAYRSPDPERPHIGTRSTTDIPTRHDKSNDLEEDALQISFG